MGGVSALIIFMLNKTPKQAKQIQYPSLFQSGSFILDKIYFEKFQWLIEIAHHANRGVKKLYYFTQQCFRVIFSGPKHVIQFKF